MDGGSNQRNQEKLRARASWLDKVQSKYLRAQRDTLIENLMKYDVDGKGKFEIEQVADIVQSLINEKKETQRKNKIIILLSVSMLIFAIIVLCVCIAANELTKEIKIDKDDYLMKTTDGNIVATGTVMEHHQFEDLLGLKREETISYLEAVTVFSIKMESEKLIWLKPAAFTVDLDDANAVTSEIVIHSSFSEYALLVNETGCYYQNGTGVWYQTANDETGGNGMSSLQTSAAASAGSIFG